MRAPRTKLRNQALVALAVEVAASAVGREAGRTEVAGDDEGGANGTGTGTRETKKRKKRSTGSRTLARGLALLNALGEAEDGATVSALSEATDLDRAVLYRLLETLTNQGFVTRDEETRKYRLGLSMLELGVRAAQSLEVRRLAGPALRSLAEDTDETACLAVRDRDDLVVVDVVEPAERFVQVNYRVGFRHPLGVSAHGKALLAFLPEGAGDGSLQSVRQRGVAYTRDELESGAAGVAAPVFDHSGQAVAAVGIVAPAPRLPEPESVALRVLRGAREISERLGWRPKSKASSDG